MTLIYTLGGIYCLIVLAYLLIALVVPEKF
ncbi:hypothetical protein DSM104443_03308 [Usitatibacter rugosus]|uniref:K+-transporting ATPase KdpF subunit n=1 Tax=Usitatibacter rugosus TaxID=2732067 RepID=A0A6M4H0Q5_9PROT|nr:hypothetical protein DSM104443_03308 [Usitatibacter rugosus]